MFVLLDLPGLGYSWVGRYRRELMADPTVTFYDMYSLRLGLIMLIKCIWTSEIES